MTYKIHMPFADNSLQFHFDANIGEVFLRNASDEVTLLGDIGSNAHLFTPNGTIGQYRIERQEEFGTQRPALFMPQGSGYQSFGSVTAGNTSTVFAIFNFINAGPNFARIIEFGNGNNLAFIRHKSGGKGGANRFKFMVNGTIKAIFGSYNGNINIALALRKTEGLPFERWFQGNKLIGNVIADEPYNATDVTVRIGRNNASGANNAPMELYEAMLWNRALSDTDIDTLHDYAHEKWMIGGP